jgi:hypothetical protein
MEVLVEGGRDPELVLHCLNNYYREQNQSFDVFATVAPEPQSNKLSFAEYRRQCRSIAYRRMGSLTKITVGGAKKGTNGMSFEVGGGRVRRRGR